MSDPGAEPVARRPRIPSIWREHRARWTLPLVIIVIIGVVATVDHSDSQRISQVDQPQVPPLVATVGGSATVHLAEPWSGFNPNTPGGASSSSPALLASVLPSAYVISPKLVPEVNSDLLTSVEVVSTSPLTIQYVINPKAVWSDGVPVTADDFIYAWQSQRGTGVDVDGQTDQVASTLGYRDVSSVTGSTDGRTVTVVFATPFTDWRIMFDHMVPAHIARRVGWNTGFARFDPTVDLSAGPMVVASVGPDDTATLVRNPRWWGTKAVLDRVEISAAQAPSGWIGSLASSNDAVSQPSSFDLSSLNAVTGLPNTQSYIKPSLDLLSLEFNTRSTVTGRVAARQAIAHAIDRTALLTRTFGSVDPDMVVNQDHLAVAWQSSYDASTAAGEYTQTNPAATDQLLGSVGYHQDPSGAYVDASGRPLVLRMAVEEGDPWIAGVGDALAAQLRSAGIGVTVVPVDGMAGVAAAAASNAYDMVLVTRTFGAFESVMQGWYSDGEGRAGTLDSQDWSMFDDPQVDQLFLQASQDLNPVTGAAVYAQIDDQLWDQMVALPLFGEPELIANGVQLANAGYNPSVDGVLWNVADWTVLTAGPTTGEH